MNRTLTTATIPILMIAGCSTSGTQPDPMNGAKPITVVTPSPTTAGSTEVQAPSSTVPIPETPDMPVPDSMPRETDYNNVDVGYVAESVVRSERIMKAAELYLANPTISAAGIDVATRAKSQHSASLMAQKEMLAAWGVSNPETIFPANPQNIPTEADIDQLGALNNGELDKRFLELMLGNLKGAAESAKQHVAEGFNPEVKATAELVISELEKEKASITEAMP